MADQRRASAFASYDRDLSDPWASRQSGLSTLANGSSTAPYTVPETTSGSVIADSDWPESYHAAWASLAVSGGNAVPFDQLQKLLAGTGLSSAQVARIVQLSSLRAPRVGRGEFAVALALAALAQQGQGPFSFVRSSLMTAECTIEAVVSRKTSPPEPSLPSVGNRPRKVSLNGVAASDPWASRGASASPEISTSNQLAQSHYPGADFATSPGGFGGETEDTEPAVWPATLERDREVVTVELDPELAGKWLGKFSLYHVGCQKRGTIVPRRFSDFAWLLGCLERRYAFRLLPTMPPKRVALNGSHGTFRPAQRPADLMSVRRCPVHRASASRPAARRHVPDQSPRPRPRRARHLVLHRAERLCPLAQVAPGQPRGRGGNAAADGGRGDGRPGRP